MLLEVLSVDVHNIFYSKHFTNTLVKIDLKTKFYQEINSYNTGRFLGYMILRALLYQQRKKFQIMKKIETTQSRMKSIYLIQVSMKRKRILFQLSLKLQIIQKGSRPVEVSICQIYFSQLQVQVHDC
ncbi:Hypothetical_protein [Hexamita inflata]|uniref:Hypothetical_protein n=1 Tax=Hexamita inflata TaxID=28002 RepID=A0AA86UGY7_9EUKA|nr:Hypothetical protein HINF_LOCUS43094 [Hexamita inflata]